MDGVAGSDAGGPMALSEGMGFRIGRLARTLRRSWTEQLVDLDLTPPLAAVLRGVAESPGVSVRALARTIGTDPMSIKRCADELESRGLLASGQRDGDRRPRTLTLTSRGTLTVSTIDQRLRLQEATFDTAFDEGERAAFEALLARLERALGVGDEANFSAHRRVVLEHPEKADRNMNHAPKDTRPEHAFWDRRYGEQPWPSEPDASLVARVGALRPGRALDLGCGTGRNALWLARRGWAVTGVDGSAVGLALARASAHDAGLALDLVEADLLEYRPTPRSFDLVVVANIHLAPDVRGDFFVHASAAVAAGGHLFVTGHHLDSLGRTGPPDPERLYTLERAQGFAPGLVIESLEREFLDGVADDESISDVVLFAHRESEVAS